MNPQVSALGWVRPFCSRSRSRSSGLLGFVFCMKQGVHTKSFRLDLRINRPRNIGVCSPLGRLLAFGALLVHI
jgi:hypothetical protein